MEEKEIILEMVKEICKEMDVRYMCKKIIKKVSIIINEERG
jgi:hypothetical protein